MQFHLTLLSYLKCHGMRQDCLATMKQTKRDWFVPSHVAKENTLYAKPIFNLPDLHDVKM